MRPCESCGATNWGEEIRVPCTIVAPTTIFRTALAERCCLTTGCDTTLRIDGEEYFFLRKGRWNSPQFVDPSKHEGVWLGLDVGRHELGFHWQLLYTTLYDIFGGAKTWHSAWTSCCEQIWDLTTEALTDKQFNVLQQQYKVFQQATMDFRDLQMIDFKQAFHCPHGLKHMSVDGICLSCHVRDMRLVRPWWWDGNTEAPLVYGSKHADRMVVPTKAFRDALRSLSRVKGGLLHDEFQQLMSELSESEVAREQVLANFLDLCVNRDNEDRVTTAEWARRFVYNLGSGSPACAYLPPAAYAVVEHWIKEALDPKAHPRVEADCIVLHKVMVWTDGKRRSPAQKDLDHAAVCIAVITSVLEVCALVSSWLRTCLCDACICVCASRCLLFYSRLGFLPLR